MTTRSDCHISSDIPSRGSKGYVIHPLELAICGYSGSGKTTLIRKVVEILSKQYDILYFKHNAHGFEMDREGKDTQVVRAGGARSVFINDSRRIALIGERDICPSIAGWPFFLNHDFALIEGGKDLPIDKIAVLSFEDGGDGLTEEIASGNISQVIAQVSGDPAVSSEGIPVFSNPSNHPCPHFHRDQPKALARWIENYFHQKTADAMTDGGTDGGTNGGIKGLITIGGKSSRMGKDKFTLTYKGEKQIDRLYKILNKFCDQVFISCREDQLDCPEVKGLPAIIDRITGIGPLAGILSAQMEYPHSAWLVAAVDLLNLDEAAVSCLIKNRNPFKAATCFHNRERGWPEPLAAIYEPKSHPLLFHHLGAGHHCPRRFLMNSRIHLVDPPDPSALNNVNTPADYQTALRGLTN